MSTEAPTVSQADTLAVPPPEMGAVGPYAEERRLVEKLFESEAWKRLEAIEGEMEQMPQVELPLHHVFTPHLYTREILLKKGTLLTSRIHLTEHPFVLSSGAVSVWTEDGGCVFLRAPHTGVTKAGTRRLIYAHEDTIWSTFHVTEKTDPDEIVKEITFTEGKFAELGAAAARLGLPEPQTKEENT